MISGLNKYLRYKSSEIKNNNDNQERGNIDLSVSYFLKFKINKEKKILDIGTNIGTFPFKLYKLGYSNVFGIEPRQSAVVAGKKMYAPISNNLIAFDGLHIPFEPSQFDIVTLFDVMEHVPNVNRLLLEVNRILKPQGIIIYQTPNKIINSMFAIIDYWSFPQWKKDHCSLQTPSSLKKALDKSGFREVTIEKYTLLSDFNKKKIRKHFGIFGEPILKLANHLPLSVFPNLWGCAKKK
jgi:2-polyprenyl-3-methyl-5-hydroxy-6-metoxy-1,4-benzoquinol methylase